MLKVLIGLISTALYIPHREETLGEEVKLICYCDISTMHSIASW